MNQSTSQQIYRALGIGVLCAVWTLAIAVMFPQRVLADSVLPVGDVDTQRLADISELTGLTDLGTVSSTGSVDSPTQSPAGPGGDYVASNSRYSSKELLTALSAADCPKVPLPPALPLLLGGLLGLAGFARLRKGSNASGQPRA
jgi:hypothetical protein